MSLYKYGIEEENSHIRAHVSLPGRCITVFRTPDMWALIKTNHYHSVYASQPGVSRETAKGWLVPLEDIDTQWGCVLRTNKYCWDKWDHEKMSLGERGVMAVHCVRTFIIKNHFPLWIHGKVNEDIELDITGTDIIIDIKKHIQVKYDAKAYPREEGGSGNLFIQEYESNPLKVH